MEGELPNDNVQVARRIERQGGFETLLVGALLSGVLK